MLTAEQNFRLLQEIEENRRFLLMAYQQNPKLLESAEARIKQLFGESVRHDHPLPRHPRKLSLPQRESEVKPFHLQEVRRWVPRCFAATLPQSPRGKGGEGGKQRGISLIELIMFIVIMSIALAGILTVMNRVTGHSADTLIRKQALAIAESLLEEVELMPFTYCDPDDPTAASATSPAVVAGGCTVRVEALGRDLVFVPQPGDETRYSNTSPFDNVNDYNGCQLNAAANAGCDAAGNSGITDITGTVILPAASGYSAAITVAELGIPAVGAAPAIPGTEALLITVTVSGPDNTSVVLDGYRTRYSPRSVP